jgi:hypothetical protein
MAAVPLKLPQRATRLHGIRSQNPHETVQLPLIQHSFTAEKADEISQNGNCRKFEVPQEDTAFIMRNKCISG